MSCHSLPPSPPLLMIAFSLVSESYPATTHNTTLHNHHNHHHSFSIHIYSVTTYHALSPPPLHPLFSLTSFPPTPSTPPTLLSRWYGTIRYPYHGPYHRRQIDRAHLHPSQI